jgi:chromosome segregation ATPase
MNPVIESLRLEVARLTAELGEKRDECDALRQANENNLAGWHNDRTHLAAQRDEAREELAQALNRAECAEAECREERERANSGDWVEKSHAETLDGAFREANTALRLVEAGLRGFCISVRLMGKNRLAVEGTMRNHGLWREPKPQEARP